MEKELNKVLENVVNQDHVSGCLVSDKQGLCLGSTGNAISASSGIITAISEYAKKLERNELDPVIVLENNKNQCIIWSNEKIVISIYKNIF